MRSVVIPCSHLDEQNELELIALLTDVQAFATLQIAKSDLLASVRALSNSTVRRRATVLLERLRKASRLVDCAAFSGTCKEALCEAELAAANVMIDDGCSRGVGCSVVPAGCDIVPLSRYILSGVHEQLTSGDFSKLAISRRSDWEENILKPLFRFAKSLYIVDYVAGRNMAEFSESLDWVITNFRSRVPQGEITLFTSVQRRSEVWDVKRWAGDRVKPEFRMYNPNHAESMPHDRFLITQSVGVQIGRGMNLRLGDSVRGSSVHIVKEPGDIVNSCFRAPRPRLGQEV